jgi:hypothetical protein
MTIDFDADLAMATADLPTSITVGASTASAVVTETTEGAQVELEGIMVDVSAQAYVRIAILARPTVGARCTIASRAYRIVRISDSPCGTAYRMDLEALTK